MKTNSFYIGIILVIITFSIISCEKEEELEIEYGTFIDSRDGYEYKTVKIGDQWWMAENLNYDAGSGSLVYDNNLSNAATYGRLYDWETACDVCPDGWHLPSLSEWGELTDYLGGDYSVAGGKMKESGTTHWNSPNTGATNSSGFTALPGGCGQYDVSYYGIGETARFWSSVECAQPSTRAWARTLDFNSSKFRYYSSIKETGFSVRCVRDK